MNQEDNKTTNPIVAAPTEEVKTPATEEKKVEADKKA